MTTAAGGEPCVLLHDALELEAGDGSLLFEDARGVVTCKCAADIGPAMARAEAALADGLHLAGAFAYELGYHLEPRLRPLARDGNMLFQLGAFARCRRLSRDEAQRLVVSRGVQGDLGERLTRVSRGETVASHGAKAAKVRDYILAGDIYQANLTFPLTFPWRGDVWSLYARLAPHQRVAFGAVVDLPDCRIASLSPELFFRIDDGVIRSRPMKGTMPRGSTPEDDAELAERLRNDPKNRAENLMILDLIRNDIGRLAQVGSVRVPCAFHVETYDTLHQMTSTVVGTIDGERPLLDIFRHLFPCGSVTGAPKIRAMEIIAELEDEPRGFYTGALGYVAPQRRMAFSVPIRTVVLDGEGRARMGVGSGIVADSDPTSEYEECLLKAHFLELGLA